VPRTGVTDVEAGRWTGERHGGRGPRPLAEEIAVVRAEHGRADGKAAVLSAPAGVAVSVLSAGPGGPLAVAAAAAWCVCGVLALAAVLPRLRRRGRPGFCGFCAATYDGYSTRRGSPGQRARSGPGVRARTEPTEPTEPRVLWVLWVLWGAGGGVDRRGYREQQAQGGELPARRGRARAGVGQAAPSLGFGTKTSGLRAGTGTCRQTCEQ
jgi:hypothetical protein